MAQGTGNGLQRLPSIRSPGPTQATLVAAQHSIASHFSPAIFVAQAKFTGGLSPFSKTNSSIIEAVSTAQSDHTE